MHAGLEDAVRLGKCLTLRIHLSQFTTALQRLIDLLDDRADEATNEDLPSAAAGHRFRQRFEDCMGQFWCTVGFPSANERGIRATVYGLTIPFASELVDFLPSGGRCIIDSLRGSPLSAVDWDTRLKSVASRAESLARRLRQELAVAQQALSNKLTVGQQMDESIREITDLFEKP